jgi:hypothetical protein
MKESLIHFTEKTPKWIYWLLILVSTLVVGLIDYVITIDLSLSIFYLFPVAITCWFIGFYSGLIISILYTILCYIADTRAADYTPFWLPFWNASVRFGFFIIVNYLLSA